MKTLMSILKVMCIIGFIMAVFTLGASAPISAVLVLPYCIVLGVQTLIKK